MDEVKKLLSNAEIAFANKQYNTALKWYQKVLEITPDDLYVLSRAGAICVPLGKFEEAMLYFGRAKNLNPENGDNAFNYGNACFFNKNYVKAFEQYAEAEKLGCSDDVKPRLYYQMALLCSMRQDITSALIYFRKCEESDKNGMISLNPDLISEKLKMYMIQQDYANAEKCAAQLVAIKPTDFKSYMVYFSILMARKNYEKAENLLNDAEQYAELSGESSFALVMQKAALQAAKGSYESVIQILEERQKQGGLSNDQCSQLLIALVEAYSKSEDCDTAIEILQGMLNGQVYIKSAGQSVGEQKQEEEVSLDPEFPEGQELHEPVAYDEEGRPVYAYDMPVTESVDQRNQEEDREKEENAENNFELPKEQREKVIFTLLSCYLAKDDFAEAQKLADVLKNSKNKYYCYFGSYTRAMTERKLTGNSDAANRKYAETLAFFRSKMFADATDILACIFRARLYAEEGKYEKAAEIACLLSESDRKSVLEYIESCRQ